MISVRIIYQERFGCTTTLHNVTLKVCKGANECILFAYLPTLFTLLSMGQVHYTYLAVQKNHANLFNHLIFNSDFFVYN